MSNQNTHAYLLEDTYIKLSQKEKSDEIYSKALGQYYPKIIKCSKKNKVTLKFIIIYLICRKSVSSQMFNKANLINKFPFVVKVEN